MALGSNQPLTEMSR